MWGGDTREPSSTKIQRGIGVLTNGGAKGGENKRYMFVLRIES